MNSRRQVIPVDAGKVDDKRVFSDIPGDVLAGLLDIAGKAEGISPRPLMGKPSKLDAHQLAELYAGGFIELPEKSSTRLSQDFSRVAAVLLNPQTNVTLRAWGENNISAETNIQFPGPIQEGDGIILNQIGSYYRITAFVDDRDITRLLGGFIPGGPEEDIDFEFESHLNTVDAAVLFGAIDLARGRENKSGQDGSDIEKFTFTARELVDYLTERWGLTSFGDLVTYVAAAGLMPDSPSLTSVAESLKTLVRTGALKEAGRDSYSLSLALEPLVTLTGDLCSGLQWQRLVVMENDELLWSSRIYLFGDRSLILCLAPTVQGRIFISRVKKQEMLDFLLDEMSVTLVPVVSETAEAEVEEVPQDVSAMFCEKCGTELKPGAKFCPKCGNPVEAPESARNCPSCGRSLKPGAKFCANCGTVVSEKKPAPKGLTCPNCGHELKPNARFCPGCGRPVDSGRRAK